VGVQRSPCDQGDNEMFVFQTNQLGKVTILGVSSMQIPGQLISPNSFLFIIFRIYSRF